MAETLEKLRPDRDLQCYFLRPSAVAALSGASATGFTVSGSWRQQFDWAVVEWNRDNVFEHPAFRNLPDGDLSGVVLTYEEERTNCLPMDSSLYPTVDWPYLRVWLESSGADPYKVPLRPNAVPVAGSYTAAWAEFELMGSITAGDLIGLSWETEQFNYTVTASDTLASAVAGLASVVSSTMMTASVSGTKIRLTLADATTGVNGNRVGAYGFVSGARTEVWSPMGQGFAGGSSPSRWKVTLDFSNLRDAGGALVPMQKVRKMRWTYGADFQQGAFGRSEFSVRLTNWSVTGTGRGYQVAGPGSRRIEENDARVQYTGSWAVGSGNFSGGGIRSATVTGASASVTYVHPGNHELYLGTRYAFNGASVTVRVDGQAPRTVNLLIPGEDTLARIWLGSLGPGTHTVQVSHAGPDGNYLYLDFFEIAQPVTNLPVIGADLKTTLATDWDTDHSIALAAERTAWMIQSLGFKGRANHYVGALWFYELVAQGNVYASSVVTFTGTPVFSQTTTIQIGQGGVTTIAHLNRFGDTAATIAKAFELRINNGYTAIRALASGNQVTVSARAMGDQSSITVAASPTSGTFTATVSSGVLAGGDAGTWVTDLTAMPRVNRAARDWAQGFFSALKGYGIDAVAAFSMELQHGDRSTAAGFAQRYPDGAAVELNTPAVQTNFSPVSTAFWRQVYLDMAGVMAAAGVQPYLQFGEVQWWYFPRPGVPGMTYYDDYTKSTFRAVYGRDLAFLADGSVDPAAHPEEAAFLPGLIGAFTSAVMSFVKASYGNCRFEVLYPPDVNDVRFNTVVNYPSAAWTPGVLTNLKTESFTYTGNRNLNLSKASMENGVGRGFTPSQRSHLVGISDPKTAWMKEMRMARAEGVESVVLFALDQYCLLGYPAPLPSSSRRSLLQG